MRILEVRDGFIKFEARENIVLSSFIKICDTEKSYIAQVIQNKKAGEIFTAYAKILFLYNGNIYDYDKTLPSINAELTHFPYNEFAKEIVAKNPIIAGFFGENLENILLDKDIFNKKTLLSIDSKENNNIIVKNLAKQFNKSLVIDTLGVIEGKKFIAGIDFKLPLNTSALQFLFEDCLNDATSDSKNLIKEIFQDLAEYSRTVDFLPFSSLKAIIDDMVEKSHVFKLLVLKNKLSKFDKLGYFASTQAEVNNLNEILTSGNAVIDLSKLDVVFQNRYLEIILSTLRKQNSDIQVFIEASNTVNKKNLKEIITGDLSSTLVTHSKFKYINEIKKMFTNFIIEPSFVNNEVFKTFSTLLSGMNPDSYLVIGEGTNSIPLISKIKEIPDKTPIKEVQQEDDITDEEILTTLEATVSEQPQSIEEELLTPIEQEPSIEAIEKKSEDLIEKVAEEVLTEEISEGLNLFEEKEEEILNVNEENIQEHLEETEEIIKTQALNTIDSASEDEVINDEVVTISEEELDYEPNIESVEEVVEEPAEFSEQTIEEFHTQVDEYQTIEISAEMSEFAEEAESLVLEEANEALLETETEAVVEALEEDINENVINEYSETEPDITPIEPISDDNEFIIEEDKLNFEVQNDINNDDDFGEIIELDESELSDSDIIVEFEDEPLEEADIEDLDKKIVEDVDKVFTTMKEDSISDSDLDFIDELNGSLDESNDETVLSEEMEELVDFSNEEAEDSFLEPLEEISDSDFKDNVEEDNSEKEILETKNSSTTIVPVYGAEIPAEDIVMSDNIEQGDTVVHAKYGNGVVEKMIKYGTKTLYSINFDNVGRRLLDPTLTEIKKA